MVITTSYSSHYKFGVVTKDSRSYIARLATKSALTWMTIQVSWFISVSSTSTSTPSASRHTRQSSSRRHREVSTWDLRTDNVNSGRLGDAAPPVIGERHCQRRMERPSANVIDVVDVYRVSPKLPTLLRQSSNRTCAATSQPKKSRNTCIASFVLKSSMLYHLQASFKPF